MMTTKPVNIRNHSLSYTIIDLVIVYAAIIASFWMLKNSLTGYKFNFGAFLHVSPYIGVAYLILNYLFELYKSKEIRFFGVAYKVALVVVLLLLITTTLSFFSRSFAYPRSILLLSSVFQFVFLTLWRVFANRLYYKTLADKKTVIIGHSYRENIKEKLESIGFTNTAEPTTVSSSLDIEALKTAISKYDIVYMSEDIEPDKRNKIIQFCHGTNQPVFFSPSFDDMSLLCGELHPISDTFVYKVNPYVIDRPSLIIKRIVDVTLGLLGLLVFAIPMILIWLCMTCGKGKAIYCQKRVKRDGKLFDIYKFRTMIPDAEAKTGPILAGDDDARITRLGYFLRKSRMDEFPQIFNVLKGDMSIVGPRPERPFFVEQYIKEMPEYEFRHRVKPGLTGLAQVRGRYNTTVGDKLKFDLMYISTYSLILDIQLIFQTVSVLLDGKSTEGIHSKI